jgi:hypothetical protein
VHGRIGPLRNRMACLMNGIPAGSSARVDDRDDATVVGFVHTRQTPAREDAARQAAKNAHRDWLDPAIGWRV